MLFRDTIAVFCENYTKLWGHGAELPAFKEILHSDSTSYGMWRRVAESFQTFPRIQWENTGEASNIAAVTWLGYELGGPGFEYRQR